ncbi:hypothetical protein B1L11_23405 [Microbispora sp. GKU 823]|nr:hypothetical protein B1L11_23405 [Microbispora sp. GKU 823]
MRTGAEAALVAEADAVVAVVAVVAVDEADAAEAGAPDATSAPAASGTASSAIGLPMRVRMRSALTIEITVRSRIRG